MGLPQPLPERFDNIGFGAAAAKCQYVPQGHLNQPDLHQEVLLSGVSFFLPSSSFFLLRQAFFCKSPLGLLARCLVFRWPALAWLLPGAPWAPGGGGAGLGAGGDLPGAIPASCPLLAAPS
jgi:hypothetical protein